MSPAETDAGSYGVCQAYISSADLSIPVSFGAQVGPIFQKNCATGGTTCHGDVNNTPYLGSADAGVDAATIIEKIVGVAAGEDPAMNLVARADPARSFLMHKMDGDQCTLAQECDASVFHATLGNCGANMPFQLGMLLPTGARDTVRSWIQQGAQNN
jgi:hypothetical protein